MASLLDAPRRVQAWFRRVAYACDRSTHERAILEELEAHVELHTAENVRRGLTRDAARRDALMALGGVSQTVDACADCCSVAWLGRLIDEFRGVIRRATSRYPRREWHTPIPPPVSGELAAPNRSAVDA